MELTLFVLLIAGCMFAFGWLARPSKKGQMLPTTKGLHSDVTFEIVCTDKKSTTIECQRTGARFLVSTKVFGGKPVRPLDVVIMASDAYARKKRCIPLLGYKPLITMEETVS